MAADRQRMTEVLKARIVPWLRQRGFKGSFPHFRRLGASKTDLLSFQFDKWGGGIINEIVECPPGEFVQPWGERVPADKLTSVLLPGSYRARLATEVAADEEKWFRYDANSPAAFEAAADEVLKVLPQADKWWQGEKVQPNVRE
jgi:hypothetical protein